LHLDTLLAILGPACVAGLLVLSTHVPLGREVLRRGIIFIDLAIAQIAALGVIAAHRLHLEQTLTGVPEHWREQLMAGAAALVGALLLYSTERRWREIQEALIGTAFVLAATGAILLLTRDPHGGEHLRDLLAGQILWVSYADLAPLAWLNLIILALYALLRRRAGSLLFYVLFALAVTASVQIVGVYLVFASLIVPALAIRQLSGVRALLMGYVLGATGYTLGLGLSALLDLPSGPAVVWTLALVAGGYTTCRQTA